jgi:hypothetical protein
MRQPIILIIACDFEAVVGVGAKLAKAIISGHIILSGLSLTVEQPRVIHPVAAQ